MTSINYEVSRADEIDAFYPFFKENVARFFSDEYTPKTLEAFFTKVFSKERFERSLVSGGYLMFAKEGARYIGLIYQQSKEEGGLSYANWLIVDKDYHGRGIGKTLLKLWEKESLKRGVHTIYLETEKNNIGFYEKCGFIYMGLMKNGWFGADDYYMYKNIQKPEEKNYLK